MKYLVIGSGAMAFFVHLGVISSMKHENMFDDLEEISGASAGSILAFLFIATKGDLAKILDYSISVPVKQIMKPNIRSLLKNYGLVPSDKLRKLFSEACEAFTGKSDMTFQELYEYNPIKLHVSTYCVDLMKTVYFSVDSAPTTSVLDALCASVAVPFLISGVKMKDGWNYIDGAIGEVIPAAPFIGKINSEIFAIRIGWGRLPEINSLKTYAVGILNTTFKNRPTYDVPLVDIDIKDIDIYDFGASNEAKLKMFLLGRGQKIS
jgi:predicted acylesterase/phospholipase RssA